MKIRSKSIMTVGLATLITVGIVYGAGFLTPGANQTNYFNYSYISTNNSTTTVKNSNGVLYALTIATPATTSTITVFDGTVASNTIITRITYPSPLLNSGPQTVILDVFFQNSLTVQQTGGTSTITVSYF